MSLLAAAELDSAFINSKPYRKACRRQDNPMPFNNSDWFRKHDEVRWWVGLSKKESIS